MNRKHTVLTLAMAAIIQAPLLFYGVDLADTGFYMSFYEWIFKDPACVEYNFMYYLTGIVGGIWHSIWPGLLSLRVLGLLVNLCTVWVLTRIITDVRALAASVAMVLFGLYISPSTFNYDTLSACLTVTGLWFMIRSGKTGWKWTFVAGIIMGINVFSRVSNLAGLGYVLYYLIQSFWHRNKPYKAVLWYLAGWATGVCLVLLLMLCLGHIDVFTDNLTELLSIAGAEQGEASHGLGNLIGAMFRTWKRILKFSFVATVLICLFCCIRKYVSIRSVRMVLLTVLSVFLAYVMYRSSPVTVTAGIGLIGCVAVFINSKGHCLWDEALCGLLMLFIMPLGSDGGIYNTGTLATWLPLAVAMAFFMNPVHAKRRALVPGISFSIGMAAVFCLIMIVYVVRNGVYFDDTRPTDRLKNICGQPIYTSSERQELIEDLVTQLNRHIKSGDVLMVYGTGPTLNYLTHTRPWLGCSWPEQFMVSSLRQRMAAATDRPTIAILKFDTIGSEFGDPSADFAMGGDENIYHNRPKSACIYEYIESHGYTLVSDNEYMAVYR